MNLERLDNLDQYIAEGRLIRKAWSREENGRQLACLLVAIAPEVGNGNDPSRCPSSVMPAWLAHLTTWIDDAGTEAHWPAVVKRYASLARRWHVLLDEDWRRLDYACRAVPLRYLITQGQDPEGVVARVLALCDRAAAGDQPTQEEWAARAEAARAAMAVAAAAEPATAWAAMAAAWAATAVAAEADAMIDGILDTIEAAIATHEIGGLL